MSIVYVTNFEAGTLTRKTTRTEGRKTTLVSHLSEWVGLVHELRECVSTKERVDNAGNGLGVNQFCWCEHFVVTYIHTLANGTAHTCQTNSELVGELLANGTNATIAQVVDIINYSL